MRTDEILYSGITSAASRRVAERRKAEEIKRSKSATDVIPAGTQLLDYIQSEKAAIPTRLWELINVETPKDNVKEVSIALRLYDDMLARLSTQVKLILKKELKSGE